MLFEAFLKQNKTKKKLIPILIEQTNTKLIYIYIDREKIERN